MTGKANDIRVIQNLIFVILSFVELFKLFQKRYIFWNAMICNIIFYWASYVLVVFITTYYFEFNN